MRIRITLKNSTRQEIIKEMAQALKSEDHKYLKRLEFILLLAQAISFPEMSVILQKTESCLYQWFHKFIAEGVPGLKYKRNEGRKSLLSKYQRRKLKEMIKKSPEEFGYQSALWNSGMIADLIEKKFYIEYSVSYIPELLKGLGFSHKKVGRKSNKADKEAQKLWEEKTFPAIVRKALKERALILFEDESTAMMWSQSGYSWVLRGLNLEMPVKMCNKNRKVFGAIELTQGNLFYQISEKAKAVNYSQYLEFVSEIFIDRKVYMVIDNGPCHKVIPPDNIELCRLPYYSPVLNPIEKMWKKLKNRSLHNRFFENEEKFVSELTIGLEKIAGDPDGILSVMNKWVKIYKNIEQKFERWNHVKSLFDKAHA